MKVCPKCKTNKKLKEYGIDKKRKFGVRTWCKKCHLIGTVNYHRSKLGLIGRMYSGQKAASIKRGHEAPSYSKAELKDWLFSQKIFHELYNNWVKSDYYKLSIPSVDRIDDNKGYSFDNIQLMTWNENQRKFNKEFHKSIHVPVDKYSLSGSFIKSYRSIQEAIDDTGINRAGISLTCSGKYKYSGGFLWKYHNIDNIK